VSRKMPRDASLAEVQSIMLQTPRAIMPVAGDCLEGARVEDGGLVAVDFTRRPAPHQKGRPTDICLCYGVFHGRSRPSIMLKGYIGLWGPLHMVTTVYRRGRMNLAMEAQMILGIVFASWGCDGSILWARDPAEYPAQLPGAPTIKGEVCPDHRSWHDKGPLRTSQEPPQLP